MSFQVCFALVAAFTPPVPGTKHLPQSARAGRMLAIPDMSPNSLLFTQDHGPRLNFFAGGNIQALWRAIPSVTVRNCCPPLDFLVGGNLMSLWASVVDSEATCLSTPARAVAGRHAALSMSGATRPRMSDDATPLDYFGGGDLHSLWRATQTAAEPLAPRMRGRPAARPRTPGVVAFGGACPLDAEDLNFFSGGSLRCLWQSAAAEDFEDGSLCLRQRAELNFFAGGGLVSLWKEATE